MLFVQSLRSFTSFLSFPMFSLVFHFSIVRSLCFALLRSAHSLLFVAPLFLSFIHYVHSLFILFSFVHSVSLRSLPLLLCYILLFSLRSIAALFHSLRSSLRFVSLTLFALLRSAPFLLTTFSLHPSLTRNSIYSLHSSYYSIPFCLSLLSCLSREGSLLLSWKPGRP